MGETAIEVIAVEFLGFLFGVLEKLISVFAGWWIVYVLLRFILHKVVFKNDADGWRRFAGNIRSGVEGVSETFREALPGVVSVVKRWSDEKQEEWKRQKNRKEGIRV